MTGMTDERFELLALIFRLAGRREYCEESTGYHRELNGFGAFKDHPAAAFARGLAFGYDAAAKFAVHIEKEGAGFALLPDTASLTDCGRWTREAAAEFLPLLNDFYAQSGFAAFYRAHLPFYRAESRRLMEENHIDLEWFRPYVDPANLRCVYSPSSTGQNYGATVNGKTVYSFVSGGGAIVHEYCHSFANPIARRWYAENPLFKKWCDAAVNPEAMPGYNNGPTIAGEYVTRAYTILYHAQHLPAGSPPIALHFLFIPDTSLGFHHIQDVYAMITPHQKTDFPRGGLIRYVTGGPFELGPRQSFTFGDGRRLAWRIVSRPRRGSKRAEGAPLQAERLCRPSGEVSDVFNSQTGDLLLVDDSYLVADLGEASCRGEAGYRQLSGRVWV